MDFLGIGPLELIMILIVSLLAIGPADMVKTSRKVGKVYTQFKKSWNDVEDSVVKELTGDGKATEGLNGIAKAVSSMEEAIKKELSVDLLEQPAEKAEQKESSTPSSQPR